MAKLWRATGPRAALLAAAVLGACASSAPTDAGATDRGVRPARIVIAHRGASGERPEHTLEAYTLAIDQGADCIEPDLVMTKDGVLIARHDIYLSTTTDVASRPEFADRKRPAPDAEHAGQEDWWAADFTLAEIRTLRARQAFPGRSRAFDGRFTIPTFDEVIELARARSTGGRTVCLYPEAKAPAYHASLGLDMAAPILDALRAHGLEGAKAPVFIQTFEPEFARKMNGLTRTPVVMLAGDRASFDAAMAAPGAPFWDGVGVTHPMIVAADGSPTGLIAEAHARGELVHTWTYRLDGPHAAGETVEIEMRAALAAGVDGFFTDHPLIGVTVRDGFQQAAGQPGSR